MVEFVKCFSKNRLELVVGPRNMVFSHLAMTILRIWAWYQMKSYFFLCNIDQIMHLNSYYLLQKTQLQSERPLW